MAAIEYVPSLLEIGRVRAAAEGVPVAFLEGDAEEIGFPDNAFDVVLSTFGSMFAPNHEKARRAHTGVPPWRENRDGKTGGRRDSEEPFFGAVRQLVPPPQGQKPPSLWGTEDHLRQLFGDRVTLEVKPQHFVFRYRSPAHWIEVFSTTFGPVMKALEALDDPGRERLRLELHRVIGEFSKATDGTMVVPSEYLEVVATKS